MCPSIISIWGVLALCSTTRKGAFGGDMIHGLLSSTLPPKGRLWLPQLPCLLFPGRGNCSALMPAFSICRKMHTGLKEHRSHCVTLCYCSGKLHTQCHVGEAYNDLFPETAFLTYTFKVELARLLWYLQICPAVPSSPAAPLTFHGCLST